YLTRWGSQIVSLDTASGADSEIFDTEFKSNLNGEGNWIRGWLFDADGNIYVLAGRMAWDNVKSNLDQRGVVAKINASTNSVEWETTFGIDADSCLPNSMTFTPNGRLLIAGEVSGTFEGETGFGGKDGFLLEINAATGDIESSEIIGSANNESISQIKFQNILNDSTSEVIDQNLIIGGSFEVNRYSLEGSSESDIYLITDQGFELIGNALSNYMQGGGGDDHISSGAGNDILVGGLGNDILDGGTGSDTANYSADANRLVINLETGVAKGNGSDTLISIDNVIGGRASDNIIGNDSNNEITSGAGNDVVNAGGGDDLIVGGDGAGNDTYNGGTGIDTIKYTSAKSGITVNLSASKDQAKSTLSADKAGIGVDQLSGIENIIAGKYDDLLTGNSADNLIDGGSGTSIDKIDGSSGTDTVSFASLVASSASASGVTLNLASAKDSNGYVTASGLGGADKIKNIENVTGSSYADTLTGDSRANTFNGSSGNDLIDGGSGNAADTIDGGAATDTI
ncbi:MAG: calcium-binding protein, partial [Alphaproteobacteria bacterium]